MVFGHHGNPVEESQDSTRIVELYNETRPALVAYLCSCGLSQDHSEDVIQETFLRLVRHTAKANAGDDFRGWVFRVAYNLSMDVHRFERRWFRGNDSDLRPMYDRWVDPTPNPEEMILLTERLKHLQAAFSRLTPKQRECLLLRAKGMRYREIAAALGVSVQRVGELMQRVMSLIEID
jgi:RNA polymerase sigma-70 factor, ECF subfamily